MKVTILLFGLMLSGVGLAKSPLVVKSLEFLKAGERPSDSSTVVIDKAYSTLETLFNAAQVPSLDQSVWVAGRCFNQQNELDGGLLAYHNTDFGGPLFNRTSKKYVIALGGSPHTVSMMTTMTAFLASAFQAHVTEYFTQLPDLQLVDGSWVVENDDYFRLSLRETEVDGALAQVAKIEYPDYPEENAMCYFYKANPFSHFPIESE